ncbi:MAG: tetratricopeptide repeat protein [Ignavibacteria bacterium]|nr:tetratricopeptide repeat protein [Ignavibacteria bacterium]
MKRTLVFYIIAASFAILTQGFQCASSELATARKAMQAQDYVKAKTAINKALVTNPNDCDALVMLGEVNEALKDTDGMVEAYGKARLCPGVKPEQQTMISVNLYNLWVGQYNGGITNFNKYVEANDTQRLSDARTNLERALEIKPEYSDPLVLLGQILDIKGDTTKAIEIYQRWWEMERPGFEILRSKNITMISTRGDVIKALGTPVTTKMDSITNGVIYKDRFDVGGRDLIVFTMAEGASEAVIEGWTYNAPASVSEMEKWRTRSATISPLKSLAFIAYQRGTYTDALTWTNLVMQAKPTDQELVPLRTQLLQNLGKTDEAMAELKAQIAKEPTVVLYRLQYAAMLSGAGKYEESVSEYKSVIQMEPNNETALYNLAANYKNIASTKQRTELEKMDKSKNYRPDTTYLTDLKTSAEYFERLRKSSFKYRDDIVVLEQLANVYEVRKETAKVKMLIMELEALEDKYRTSKDYYLIMEGLYGRNKMVDKMKEAQEKGAKL